MKTYAIPIIEFILNEQIRVRILSKKTELFDIHELVLVQLHDNKNIYYLSFFWLKNILEIMQKGLSEVLNNKRPLEKSSTQDIGYIFNQLLHNQFSPMPTDSHWFTDDFHLWEWHREQPTLHTWLYNDQYGEIVLHITESYFWYGRSRNEGSNYVSYKEFMKNYKPICVAIIPHSVACEWLNQCEVILQKLKI